MKNIFLGLLFLIFGFQAAFAEMITGSSCYRFSDNETINQARDIAFTMAIKNALRGYYVFIDSTTKVGSGIMKEDLITILTTGVARKAQMTNKSENLPDREICRTIKAEVDPVEIENSITTAIRMAESQKQPPKKAEEDDKAMWDMMKDSNDIEDFRVYLQEFPAGFFKTVAKFKIRKHEVKEAITVDPSTSLVWQDNNHTDRYNIEEVGSYCENLKLGGYSDWQVPTFNELFGIYLAKDILRSYEPNNYWALLPFGGKSRYFLAVLPFYDGDKKNDTGDNHIRCVRRKKSFWKDKLVVSSKKTGLMWQARSHKIGTGSHIGTESEFIEKINFYCDNLKLGGYSDWYVPTYNQLNNAYRERRIQLIGSSSYFALDPNSRTKFLGLFTGSEKPGKEVSNTMGQYLRCARGSLDEIRVDKETGLIWQKLDYGNYREQNWLSADNYCNDLSLKGFSDWRLPGKDELVDLYKNQFELDFTTQQILYWSSTTYEHDANKMWAVPFDHGGQELQSKNDTAFVFCVRGRQQFSSRREITVDQDADLMWQDNEYFEQHSWNRAMNYCDNLELGGYSDWRLPSRNEIGLLYIRKDILRSYSRDQYWTSTEIAQHDKIAWDASFDFDNLYISEPRSKKRERYVRCVRGGDKFSKSKMVVEVGAVTDHTTGLMWGASDFSVEWSWNRAETFCKDSKIVGYSDWRLPTIEELKGIFDKRYMLGVYHMEPYWTSTSRVYVEFGGTKAIDLNELSKQLDEEYKQLNEVPKQKLSIDDDFLERLGKKAALKRGHYFRCVRGDQKMQQEVKEGKDQAQNSDVVKDIKTGLTWQRGEPGKMKWQTAVNYCKNLSLAGGSDWRLPDKDEVVSAYQIKSRFPNVHSGYWSSTSSVGGTSYAWIVMPDNGHVGGHKGISTYVRCVRGGQ
jgi:hypothetical protein